MNEPLARANAEHAARLRACIESDLQSLERLILTTPTGDARNRFCDAQIHLRAALEKLA